MKIVFWGKGERGISCLQALYDQGLNVELVIIQPEEQGQRCQSILKLAQRFDTKIILPSEPNDRKTEHSLKLLEPDLFVICGYGKILKQNILDIPKIMCINLHGGKLPKYRGSSPMNWALINGETSFTLSIIKVNAGVDTGEILLERTFDISINDTIRDLHHRANKEFPLMLIETIKQIEQGTFTLKPQDNSLSSYYPLRFHEDGLILWDMHTAEQIHNRIRALTEPYPCAFTFFNKKKVKLLSSQLCRYSYFGEAGRIYLKSNGKLLVCASDKCLWIKEAVLEDSGEPLHLVVNRYDKLATIKYLAVKDYGTV